MSIQKATQELKDHVGQMARLMNERDVMAVADRMADDIVIVRPTGNPLSKDHWVKMLLSEDVEMKGTALVDINSINVNDSCDMGYVCYTTHSAFSYKGVENNDVAVFVAIFKLFGTDWKIVYMQRSTGRLPTDPRPNFD
tara:strand:- start:129 stop:545 length:417 start_codon:yes stop_codon:yes gene_type:complete